MSAVLSYLALTLFTLTCIAVLAHYGRMYSYWRKRGVPHAEVFGPFGSIFPALISRENIYDTTTRFHDLAKPSPYLGFWVFSKPWLYIADPNLMSTIMVDDSVHFTDRIFDNSSETDFLANNILTIRYEKWKLVRNKLTPIFTAAKLKGVFHHISRHGELTVERMRKSSGGRIDLRNEAVMTIVNLMASLMFSAKLEGSPSGGVHSKALDIFENLVRSSPLLIFRSIIRVTMPFILVLFNWKRLPKSTDDFFLKVVNERLDGMNSENSHQIKKEDILQYMVECHIKDYQRDKEYRRLISDRDVAANVFGFMNAGIETTATTLAYCLLELARNQDIQDRVHAEVWRVVKNNGGALNEEALNEMTYLESVIKETMRLYPGLQNIFRECTKDYKVKDTNLTIERGVKLVMPIMNLHRNSDYFPNPLDFQPERFTKDNESKMAKNIFIPFGLGPRKCIGLRLAMVELKLIIAMIIKDLHLTMNQATVYPVHFKAHSYFLHSKTPMYINIKER